MRTSRCAIALLLSVFMTYAAVSGNAYVENQETETMTVSAALNAVEPENAYANCGVGSTNPENAFKTEVDRPWICVPKPHRLETVVWINLPKNITSLRAVGIAPGWDAAPGTGVRYLIPTSVTWVIGDTHYQQKDLVAGQLNTLNIPKTPAHRQAMLIIGEVSPLEPAYDPSTTALAVQKLALFAAD